MKRFVVGVSVFAFLVCAEVRGSLVFNFSGTVSNINDHGVPFLDSSIAVGTALVGSYTFDPDVPDSFPGLPKLGDYNQHLSASSNFGLEVGNYTLSLVGGYYHIQVENDTGSSNDDDKYEVGTGGGSWSFSNGVSAYNTVGFVLSLRDFDTGDVFTDDSLPRSLDLSRFDNGQGQILISVRDQFGGDTDIIADITTLEVAAVPEVGSLLAWAIIAVVAGGARLSWKRWGSPSPIAHEVPQ
jgi:hypothetical protein